MKALLLPEAKAPLTLQERALPTPAPGEVRVKLLAAALNHRDLYIQEGLYPGIQTPVVLGSDGAGLVDALGEGVSGWEPGDAVVINPNQNWGPNPRMQSDAYSILGMPTNGTFQGYLCVPADRLHAMPGHLKAQQAAAIPLAGLTAYRSLFTRGEWQAGDRVLVTGVGGGVAQWVLAFGLAVGAEVWVTSGDEGKLAKARELGAFGGANYRTDDWGQQLKAAGGFDVIIDSAGGEGFGELLKHTRPASRVVFYGGTRGKWPAILPQHLFWKQVDIRASTMGSDEDFVALLQLITQERIIPQVDRLFPLHEGQAAFDYLRTGKQLGKVVLVHTE